MASRARPLLLACFVVALGSAAGCGGAVETPDAGRDDAASSDANVDGGATCTTDATCDDGLFCNGTERCTAGRCASAAAPDCADAIACTRDLCSEDRRECLHAVPDADSDGHGDAACLDGAGVALGDDCDDADATAFPGAMEVCDDTAHDEDCDPTSHGRVDADSDGFEAARCCNGTSCGTDCNDGARGANPDATEVCNGIDDDCDTMIDELVSVAGFADDDADGFGDAARSMTSCGDAAGFSTRSGDCDDTSVEVNPGQLEFCDVVDNDCDGRVDEMAGAVTWYPDVDGDGFGAMGTTVSSCARVAGHSIVGTDCDDTTSSRSPRVAEVCNAVDDDCNGRADYAISPGDLEDDDGDLVADRGCGLPRGLDCDDYSPSAQPGATEVCNGLDDDCDSSIDESATSATFHRDADGDGFGDRGTAVIGCFAPAGYVVDASDCDDAAAARHPGAVEACDALDGDCDRRIDETPAESTCSIPFASASCTVGICHLRACNAGYADCTAAPGCETATSSDPMHCGGCTPCGSGDACLGGTCIPTSSLMGVLGASGNDEIHAIATAPDGSFILAGGYTGSFTSSCGEVAGTSGLNGYFERHNADGSCRGLSSLDGLGDDKVTGVAFDAAGNLYVSAVTSSATTFLPSGASAAVAGQGAEDGLVFSLDPGGILRWVYRFGGTGDDVATGLVVDGSRVFVSAGVHAPLMIDATTSFPMRDGTMDAVIFQLDAATGAVTEANTAVPNGAAAGDDAALGIAYDAVSGDVFAVGFVTVPTMFGTAERITSVGGPSDGFVWRVNRDTLLSVSVAAITGPADATATSVAVSNGTIYVGGRHIGATSLLGRGISAIGGADGFVFFVDTTTFTATIGLTLGGPGDDAVAALAADAERVSIAGSVAPGVTQLGGASVTLFGGQDGFALTLDPIMGLALQATVFGGTADDHGFAASIDGFASRFGGSYEGTVNVLGALLPDIGGGTDSVWFRVLDVPPA